MNLGGEVIFISNSDSISTIIIVKLYSCKFKGSAIGVLPFQSAGPALMLGFLGDSWGLSWGWGTLLSFFVGMIGLWMLLGGWKICYIVMQTLPR